MRDVKIIKNIVKKMRLNKNMHLIKKNHNFFDEVYYMLEDSEEYFFFDGTDDKKELLSMMKSKKNRYGYHIGLYDTYQSFLNVYRHAFNRSKHKNKVTIICYSRGVYGWLFARHLAIANPHCDVTVLLFGCTRLGDYEQMIYRPENLYTESFEAVGDYVPKLFPHLDKVPVEKFNRLGNIFTAIKQWFSFNLNHWSYFE